MFSFVSFFFFLRIFFRGLVSLALFGWLWRRSSVSVLLLYVFRANKKLEIANTLLGPSDVQHILRSSSSLPESEPGIFIIPLLIGGPINLIIRIAKIKSWISVACHCQLFVTDRHQTSKTAHHIQLFRLNVTVRIVVFWPVKTQVVVNCC